MRAGAAHPVGIVVLYFCLFAIEHNAWHINTMHHLSVLEVRKLNVVTAGLYSTGMFKGRVCFQAFSSFQKPPAFLGSQARITSTSADVLTSSLILTLHPLC